MLLVLYVPIDIMLNCRKYIMTRLSGRDSLLPHALWMTDDLIGCSLNNASGFGKLRADAHEEDVDIAGCLAAFIDTPTCC